ncbi:MAG: hypothetical protein AAFX95_24700, partial [Cyanobacteria bacterium J06639_16]
MSDKGESPFLPVVEHSPQVCDWPSTPEAGLNGSNQKPFFGILSSKLYKDTRGIHVIRVVK